MRLRDILLLSLVPGLLAAGTPARAAMCTPDDVPAATLLLPYFEVDLADGQGTNTVFTVNNASSEAALAHVTFWTDWSQPTLNFDVFLTGYDVVAVDLREAFDGILPITADAQTDPDDTISPHGLNPIWEGSFADCQNVFPFGEPGAVVLPPGALILIRNGHTGQDVLGLGCSGEDHGDSLARGYVTVDAVNRCSALFPSDAGYFADGGTGIAANTNVLWGRWAILEAGGGAFGGALAALEAEDGFQGSVPGYTFYGRYDPALAGRDNREPLATVWAVDHLQAGEAGTELLVWRDSTTADASPFYPCDTGPSWLPLGQAEVVVFDREENGLELCNAPPISPPAPDPSCFPLETQRVALGAGNLTHPFTAGWLALNLNHADTGVAFDVDFGTNGDIAQSHVTVVHRLADQLESGYAGLVWASACEDRSPLVTDTGVIPTP